MQDEGPKKKTLGKAARGCRKWVQEREGNAVDNRLTDQAVQERWRGTKEGSRGSLAWEMTRLFATSCIGWLDRAKKHDFAPTKTTFEKGGQNNRQTHERDRGGGR